MAVGEDKVKHVRNSEIYAQKKCKSGKIDFSQGYVREKSGKFALPKLWTPSHCSKEPICVSFESFLDLADEEPKKISSNTFYWNTWSLEPSPSCFRRLCKIT